MAGGLKAVSGGSELVKLVRELGEKLGLKGGNSSKLQGVSGALSEKSMWFFVIPGPGKRSASNASTRKSVVQPKKKSPARSRT